MVFAWSMQFIVIEWQVYSMTKDPWSLGMIGMPSAVHHPLVASQCIGCGVLLMPGIALPSNPVSSGRLAPNSSSAYSQKFV